MQKELGKPAFMLQLDLVPVTTGRIVLRKFDPKQEEAA